MNQTATSSQNPSPESGNPVINLFAKATQKNGGLDWDLGFHNPPENGKAKVDLPANSGEHRIHIHLVPTGGVDVAFNTGDPIWVVEGTTCPPPNGSKSDQVSVKRCTQHLLEIHDKNDGAPRTLTYQLNFVGAAPLDPQIQNGGKI